jgi:hypothetical protein
MTDRTDAEIFAFGEALGWEIAVAITDGKDEVHVMKLLRVLDESSTHGPLAEMVALAGFLSAWSRIIKNQAALIDFDQRKADNQLTFH